MIRTILAALSLAAVSFAPIKAECATCPPYPCYGSVGCLSCFCMNQGFGTEGRCVSLQKAEELEAMGWRRAE